MNLVPHRPHASAPETSMPRHAERSPSTVRVLALVCALGLSGCSLFDRGFQPSTSYLIAPPPQVPLAGERFGSLMVTRFGAIPPHDGKSFLYRNTDGTWRQDPYAGFIANPSDMMSDALVRALEQSGRCEMVGVESVAMHFDFSIEGVIEAFYADFSEPDAPKAVVRVRAYLLDRRAGAPKLVDQVVGSGTAPITAAEPGKVAEALSAAVGMAIHELLEDLTVELPKASPAQTASSAQSGL
jgi:ABC-type uncharacterized transport system auxiliary subunit